MNKLALNFRRRTWGTSKAGAQCQNQLQFYNYAKLCNYLQPQPSCWICREIFSINLLTQNKQTKSALHFRINTAQDSARSELSSTFRSAAAVLTAFQINKNVYLLVWGACIYTAQQWPVETVTSKVTQKKLWLSKAVLIKSLFHPAGVCSPSAFIHCWPHFSVHSPAPREKGLQEVTLRQIKEDDGTKLSPGLEGRRLQQQKRRVAKALGGKKQQPKA